LERQGADVITESLRQDIARQLDAGRDIAYSALSAAGALDIEREVSGEDYAEVDQLVVTDQGLYAGAAMVDKGRVTVAAGEFTDQGDVIVVGEFAPDDVEAATAEAPPAVAPPATEQGQTTPSPVQPPATDR
jgi:hypothetical protein